MSESLGEAFPKQLERVRELLKVYREIGPNGRFGVAMIGAVLKRADEAWDAQDVVEMLRVWEELKGCE